MSSTVTVSRNMPQKFSVADGGNSFILGRRAFFNNNFQSHQVQNLGNNNSSTNSNSSLAGISSVDIKKILEETLRTRFLDYSTVTNNRGRGTISLSR